MKGDHFVETVEPDPLRPRLLVQAPASLFVNHARDLAEFIRLTKLGYRYEDSGFFGVPIVVDPFAEKPVEFVR